MITGMAPVRQIPAWQRELADAITDPAELLRCLGLDPILPAAVRQAAASFPLRVPRGYVARMTPGDPADPLLRQVLPSAAETLAAPGFSADPLGERAALVAPGLLHKYQGRALLLTTPACAVHCRFCFRRELPQTTGSWRPALAYLADNPGIGEVILSGGDPLTLSNRRLGALLTQLSRIEHLQRLRIHTRVPIVLPERIEPALTDLLTHNRLPVILVLHANHPREIDANVRQALGQLRAAGVMLFNQTVLLGGINDSVEILAKLHETMFSAGVIPYYLHAPDPVRGTVHFAVADPQARTLMQQLRNCLPGYLVPRLVREEPGGSAKTPIL